MIQALYVEVISSPEYDLSAFYDCEAYFPIAGHDNIHGQEIVPFFGKGKGPVSRFVGPPHGRHAGIALHLKGIVLPSIGIEDFDLHDDRTQLGLLVKTVYQVRAVSDGDFLAGRCQGGIIRDLFRYMARMVLAVKRQW